MGAENSKNEGVRYLLKNTGLLTLSSFSSKILVFLLVPLYTSVLSTEEYGVFDLVQTTVLLLLPILTVNIYDAVMRFCMDEHYEEKIVAGVGIKYVLISITVFSLLVLVNWKFRIVTSIADYSGYTIAYYVSYLLNQFFTQYAKGKEQVKAIAVSGIINTAATLLLNIILLLYLRIGVAGFFLAYIIGQLTGAIVLIISTRFYKQFTLSLKPVYEKEMIAFSAPLVLGTIGWWCNNASDRYVITLLCGVAANGIYSVAYKIPSILTTVQQIFVQAWQISAIKGYGKEDSDRFYGGIFKATNLVMCTICMFVTLFTKPLAHMLYMKDFYAAWQYVPFLLIAGVFNSASGVLGPILNANMDSRSLGVSSLIGTVTNVCLNFVLIFFIGPQGAAIATAISSFVIFFLRKRAVKEQVFFLDYNRDIISWGIVTTQAICAVYFMHLVVQLILMCIFLIINRKDIKNLSEKMCIIIKEKLHK